MVFHPSIVRAARSGCREELATALTTNLPARGRPDDTRVYIDGIRSSTDLPWVNDQFRLIAGRRVTVLPIKEKNIA